MSYEVEDRVVEMRFDNSDFEKNVNSSIKTLNTLEEALKFDNASEGLDNVRESVKKIDFTPVQNAIETISNKFSVMEVVAITAISNITNKLINMGENALRALSITPISTGLDEYSQQLDSVMVIMANTGEIIEETTKALDILNVYADKTSYSFGDMTNAISKFAAAGVGLTDSVNAIKGLSNAAALVGASSQQLYSAYYNLAQSMQMGYMQLIDWKSLANSSIGNKNMRENFIKMAIEMGVFAENSAEAQKAYTDFNGSLQSKWLTKDVMLATLQRYAGDFTYVRNEVTGAMEAVDQFGNKVTDWGLELGESAQKAATEVKNFKQMWDVLCEAAQTGWADTWKVIIGDLNESKSLFTAISEKVSAIIEGFSEVRKDVAKEWYLADGRTQIVETILQLIKNVWSVMKPIIQAINEVFPITGKGIAGVCEGLRNFVEALELSDEAAETLRKTLVILLTPLKYVVKSVRILFEVAKLFVVVGHQLFNIICAIVNNIREVPTILKALLGDSNWSKILKGITTVLGFFKIAFETAFKVVAAVITEIIPKLIVVIEPLKELFLSFISLGSSLIKLLSKIDWSWLINAITSVITLLAYLTRGIATAIDAIAELFDGIAEGLSTKAVKVKATSKSVGNNVLEGFIEGLKNNSTISIIVRSITAIANVAIEAFKTVLGIHSPSTVFAILGGFIIAGLVVGIFSQLPTIVSVMAVVGQKVSEGFLLAVETITKSKIFQGIVANISTIGNIFVTFLKQIKPGHVVALLIAGSMLLLARSIHNLTEAFSGLNEVFEALSARIRAQAFDNVANGIVKIVAALTVLMGLGMIDPERFRSAAITIGVLAGSILALYFVLSRLDAILSSVSCTLREAGRAFMSSAFLTAFGTSILLLTVSLKMITEMDPEQIRRSILTLIVMMSSMAALSVAMATMAPRLSRGAAFLVIFALAARIMAKSLNEIESSMSSIENFQAYCAQLVATMAIVYITSRTVTTILNGLVTTIARQLTTMFYALAVASVSVGVSVYLFTIALRTLNTDIGEFNKTALECLSIMGVFIAIMSIMLISVTAIATVDQNGRIPRAILSIAGAFAIMSGSMALLSASIALMEVASRDMNSITKALGMFCVAFGEFGVTMIAITAIIANMRLNAETLNSVRSIFSAFTGLIGSFAGSLLTLTLEFAIISKFADGNAAIMTAMSAVFGMLLMMWALIATISNIVRDQNQESTKNNINAVAGIMYGLVAMISIISGALITLTSLAAFTNNGISALHMAMVGVTAILVAMGGMIAVILALVSKNNMSTRGIVALSVLMYSLGLAFLSFAASAAVLAKMQTEWGDVAGVLFELSLIMSGMSALSMVVAKWASNSAHGVEAIYAAGASMLFVATALVAFTMAATYMITTIDDAKNVMQSVMAMSIMLVAFGGVIAGLMFAIKGLNNTQYYGLIGAAIILALATAIITFTYAIKELGESNALTNIADGLKYLYENVLNNFTAILSLAFALMEVWGFIALVAPPVLVLGAACLVAGLGIAAAAVALRYLADAITALLEVAIVYNRSLNETIENMDKYHDSIISVSKAFSEIISAQIVVAINAISDSFNAISNSALKFAGALWASVIPIVILSLCAPALTPIILSIGLAFSLAATGILATAAAMYLFVANGYTLASIGEDIKILLQEIGAGIHDLMTHAFDILVLNVLIFQLGVSLIYVGTGFTLLGVGILATGVGIIAMIGGVYLALKLWADQIELIFERVKAFFEELSTNATYALKVLAFSALVNVIADNFGGALESIGRGVQSVGNGIRNVGFGLVLLAAGILAMAGALAVWGKVDVDFAEVSRGMIQLSSGILVLSLAARLSGRGSRNFIGIAAGLAAFGASLLIWQKLATNYEDIATALRAVAGGLFVMSLASLVAGNISVFMASASFGLVSLAAALALWNYAVVQNYDDITESIKAIAEALTSLAFASVAGGAAAIFMALSAGGISWLALSLMLWKNVIMGYIDDIADEMITLSEALKIFAAGTTIAGLSTLQMIGLSAGISLLSLALLLWKSKILGSVNYISEEMIALSGGLIKFGNACAIAGLNIKSMIALAVGLTTMTGGLYVFNFIADNAQSIRDAMIILSDGIMIISNATRNTASSGVSMTLLGIGLLSLTVGLKAFSFIARYANEIAEAMKIISPALLKISDSAKLSANASIPMIGLGLGIASLSIGLVFFSKIASKSEEIANGMIIISPAIEKIAMSSMIASQGSALMPIVAVGIASLALALYPWQDIAATLPILGEGMTELSPGITALSMSMMAAGSASLMYLAGAVGLTALALGISKWVDVLPYLETLGNAFVTLSVGIAALSVASIGSPMLIVLATSLGILTAVVLIASYACVMAAENFYTVISIISSILPILNSVIDGFKDVISSAYEGLSNIGGSIANATSNLGQIFTNGFAKGILDNTVLGDVVDAAAYVGQLAISTLAGPEGIDDPIDWSAATKWLGQVFTNGFSIGIKDGDNWVVKSVKTVANKAIDALEGTSIGGAVKAGYETVSGYASGIKEKIGTIWNGISNGEGLKTLFGLDFEGITDTISKAMEDLTTSFNLGDEDLYGDLASSADSAKGTIESLTDTIRNQMKMFEKFDDSTDMTASQLLSNMESQVNGITNWANGIETLGIRGMSAELIKYLSEMGPQGYKYVEAFLDMTESELAKANDLYTQSLTLPEEAANTVASGYEWAGAEIVASVSKGISGSSSGVKDATKELGDNIDAGLDEEAKDASDVANKNTNEVLLAAIEEALKTMNGGEAKNTLSRVRNALVNGWTPSAQDIADAWMYTQEEAKKIIYGDSLMSNDEILALYGANYIPDSATKQKIIDQYYKENNALYEATFNTNKYLTQYGRLNKTALTQLGKSDVEFMVDGIVMGASDYVAKCNEVGYMLGATVIGSYESVMDINSPSKTMAQEAKWTVLGLAAGFEDNKHIATDAANEVGDATTKSISDAIASISGVFGTDFDNLEPTITPVLDLTNVESGVSRLDDLLNNRRATIQTMDLRTPDSINNDAINNALNRIQALNAQQNRDLISAITNSDKPVTVNVSLEGDAAGVFKLVKDQNMAETKAQGVSPLMTMFRNGVNTKRYVSE